MFILNYNLSGSGPRAHITILTSRDQALFPEYQRRQPLVRNLLDDERFNHRYLVHPGTLCAAEIDALVVAERPN